MIKKLLIAAFVFIAVGVYTEAYSGVPCCKNGQMSTCPDPGIGSNGQHLSYDISGCMQEPERLCPDGSQSINGQCLSIKEELCMAGYHMLNGVCVKDNIAVVIKCEAFTSPAGHQVPETNRNQSVQMGCYTYTCSALGSWSTTSSCECKPGATYYRPCGDCGTQSRSCSSDGKFGLWSLCSGDKNISLESGGSFENIDVIDKNLSLKN